MTILLVRHGQTEWNKERRNQGWLDSALTQRGIAQAQAIGRWLTHWPEAADAPIVASPLGRARRTAEIIRNASARMGPLCIDGRLRELTLGSWDGLTYNEIAALRPGLFDGVGRYEWYFRSPDGESYTDFRMRLEEWLSEQDEDAPIVVVAHGLVSRVLRGLYAGLPRAEALSLPVPQDCVFRLAAGRIQRITVGL